MVRPTLEYAVEVWGGGEWDKADQIQHAVGRFLLGLRKTSAKEAVRGELGWLSMRARREIKQLIYWGRILLMDDSRLVKRVYRQCKEHTGRLQLAQGSFCHAIRELLASLNLNHLWLSEQIGDKKSWRSFVIASVKKRDFDLWRSGMQKKDTLELYRILKTEWNQEEYLSWSLSAEQMSQYARLRTGSHGLRLETAR